MKTQTKETCHYLNPVRDGKRFQPNVDLMTIAQNV